VGPSTFTKIQHAEALSICVTVQAVVQQQQQQQQQHLQQQQQQHWQARNQGPGYKSKLRAYRFFALLLLPFNVEYGTRIFICACFKKKREEKMAFKECFLESLALVLERG